MKDKRGMMEKCKKCGKVTIPSNLFRWDSLFYNKLYYWLHGEFICSECYLELQNNCFGKSKTRYCGLYSGVKNGIR